MSSTDGATVAGVAPALALTCVGLSYKTSPIEVREAVALSPDQATEAVRRLTGASVSEALVLSTCNRTEFYTQGAPAEESRRLVRDVVLDLKGLDVASLDGALYVRREPDAIRHLFRVACGLDSMVLGEPEILGQVRQAAEIASRAGGTGLVVGRMTELALAAAKRARTETAIGAGPVSIASAGVELARKVFGALAERRVLVVGAGATARLAAEHLHAAGVRDFAIANRGAERAGRLAETIGGRRVALGDLASELAWADLVVAATSSPTALVGPAEVREAIRRRSGRRIVFLDLAVPRDIAPEVNAIPNVFVHDIDALRSIVEASLERRRREVPRVEAIVEEGVERFLRWHRALAVTPTLTAFRDRAEAIRLGEMEKYRHRIGADALPMVDALTRAIVRKILHAPTARLREATGDALGPARIEALRHLFDLDGEGAVAPHPAPRDGGAGEEGEDSGAGGGERPRPEP
jgi:glutamyl-tRNA reductase